MADMEDESTPKKQKRVREACEACRRKKGRCPGERPVCSLCARLGQTCTYAKETTVMLDGIQDAMNTSYHFVPQTQAYATGGPLELDRRVQYLDDKVTEVLDQVRLLASAQSPSHQPERRADNVVSSSTENVLPPSLATLQKAAELYLQFCHCQPLPLFSPAGLALRFDPDQRPQLGQAARYRQYLTSARSITMNKVGNGMIELSTLQCLCMLALTDFNDGRPQQAGIFLSLASELARSARLDIYARQPTLDNQVEEHVRCLWSIILLQYLSGNVGTMTMTIDASSLRNPPSDGTNDLASINRQNGSYSQEGDHDLGIVMYATHMTEVWYGVRRYVYHRGKLDKHPPWSGRSEYSNIMFRQMELESQMPHKHRFKPSGFADYDISVLSTNRHYWTPWLFLQIIYHAIVCTLNHPILLSTHLRRFRVNQVPELFLQHTADLISSHTDWIIHLLEIAREKQFQFSDPFLGQLIAIVATIFLQQSYTEDQETRLDKQAKFSTCLRFVQDIGRYWSHIDQMAIDLQTFENTVSRAYQSSSHQNAPNMSQHVDLSTFWKILDNTLISTPFNGAKSIFGPSLTMRATTRNESDVLSTRLLPEPTRVNSLHHTSTSTAATPAAMNGHAAKQLNMSTDFNVGSLADGLADTPFLSQNFFALGQDFVGNADDWFNWTDP